MSAQGPFDAERLAGIQAGDPATLDQLVAECQLPLFTFAWRYLHNRADAEEVVIETFVRLHQARERLRSDTNLSAWLFTTLSNLCHNRHRWRTRHPELSLDAPTQTVDPAANDSGPSDAMQQDEVVRALQDAIAALPHDQRTVVLLHHYEQLSYRQIGEIVGCSERGVETRLYRARQQLRDRLAVYLHDALPR